MEEVREKVQENIESVESTEEINKMKWNSLSKKQMQLLTWWTEKSPYKNYFGVISEGAIRSGKTSVMAMSFLLWSMSSFNGQAFALCGKTVGSLRRNVVSELVSMLLNRNYKVVDKKAENCLVVRKGKTQNVYYLFGGRDERSQDLIQGVTLAGVMLDEVALMPQSFVEQAIARCSVAGRKFWFNCNPEGPQHWFYTDFVLKAEEKKFLRLHFSLEDNPGLNERVKEGYRNMFSGIFYRRFILGEWAFADGVIYDCFDENKNTYTNANRNEILPIDVREHDPGNGEAWYACDYGVYNPCVFLECFKVYKRGEIKPYYYVDREYYYDGRKAMRQKTDAEYVSDLLAFIGTAPNRGVIIDPSASSLIVALNRNNIPTWKAENDVAAGIRLVYQLLATGHIMINKDECPNLINELGLYIWDSKKSDGGREVPVKMHDHCCDALRYFVNTTTIPMEIFKG